MSLVRGLPIDLLPDRTVETVSAWLKKHASIDIISRDGSSEYASAIKKGAPQAREVSDRWHLVKNLAGCVSVLLAESLAQLRRAEQAATNFPEKKQHVRDSQSHPRTRSEQRTQQARQAERRARYEHITALFKQGMKSADIATQTGMTERTVRRWRETVETSLILAPADLDHVSLIHTRPTSWSAGTRAVTMEHN